MASSTRVRKTNHKIGLVVTPAQKPSTRKKAAKKAAPKKKVTVKKAAPKRKPTQRKPSVKQLPILRREALEKLNVSDMGIVDAVWLATQKDNLYWTLGGAGICGSIPLASFILVHYDKVIAPLSKWSLVIGGLVFSCITVYRWARKVFRSGYNTSSANFLDFLKATGFVVITEGVMVTSGVVWLTYMMLTILIIVNAISGGVNLALDRWKWVKNA